MATRSGNPCLLFFPYLPVQGVYGLGPWQLGPLEAYQGQWASEDFERLSQIFLSSFKDAIGNPLGNVYLLSHKKRGMDGVRPTRPQIRAIQRSIDFALLDRSFSSPQADGWFSITSDNSEFFVWPIDTAGGYVALGRGSIISVLNGGLRIDDGLAVPAPLELHMPIAPLTLDAELVTAMYGLFTRRFAGSDDVLRKRIEVAVGWLAKAWRNSPSVTMDDRIVFLKTGFEALSGGISNTRDCARWLRTLFETELAGTTWQGTSHLLWSPREKPRFTYQHASRPWTESNVTELQHWFLTFGERRNTIIHDGTSPKFSYTLRGSRYNGFIFRTAERLLRESIKVSMKQLGYPDIWRSETRRSLGRLLSK